MLAGARRARDRRRVGRPADLDPHLGARAGRGLAAPARRDPGPARRGAEGPRRRRGRAVAARRPRASRPSTTSTSGRSGPRPRPCRRTWSSPVSSRCTRPRRGATSSSTELADRFGIEHATFELECHQLRRRRTRHRNPTAGPRRYERHDRSDHPRHGASHRARSTRSGRATARVRALAARRWWQVIALVVALCLLAGIVGWRDRALGAGGPRQGLGRRRLLLRHDRAPPAGDRDGADLPAQRRRPAAARRSRRRSCTYQSAEIGMMNEYLAQWGRDGDRPAKAMGWMQPPVDRGRRCPGLRPRSRWQELAGRAGLRARQPVHRADDRAPRGRRAHGRATRPSTPSRPTTREWAAEMDDGQRGEISEMNQWRRRHDLNDDRPADRRVHPAGDADE